MVGDEWRVEEMGGKDSQNILKINTFHKPLPLLPLSSLSVPNIPRERRKRISRIKVIVWQAINL